MSSSKTREIYNVLLSGCTDAAEKIRAILNGDRSSTFQENASVLVPVNTAKDPSSKLKSSIVTTFSSSENMKNIMLAIKTRRPVIVQGKMGCGKTYLVREIAHEFGQESNIVELHVNDQSDSKTLIGSYVCSDVPGEFVWQSGIITQAVIKGQWVIIEDIDKVPLEFVAIISTLLEFRRLYLPHREIEIEAHESFRIFGTRSISSKNMESSGIIDYNTLIYVPSLRHFSHHFHFVTLKYYSMQEIEQIITSTYPNIMPILIKKLMQVYSVVNNDSIGSNGDSSSAFTKFPNMRQFSLRELLQVAGRIDIHSTVYNHPSGHLTDEYKKLSFTELLEVYAYCIRDNKQLVTIVHQLGAIWDIPSHEVDNYFIHSNPEQVAYQLNQSQQVTDNSLVKIGRVTLKCDKSILAVNHSTNSNSPQHFSFTKQALRMLERIAMCVLMNEPALLVGETGSGKTTTVQQLADILGKKMIVQNLSLSTDVSDLLGGFRPVTMKQLFLPTYESFVRLFQDTLSSSQNTEFLQIVAQYFQKQQWKKLIKAFQKACDNATKKLNQALNKESNNSSTHNSQILSEKLEQWKEFHDKIARFDANLPKIEHGFAFSFVDGLMVEAMRNGYWVLLDEINLASPETLQGLSGILDKTSMFISESGDMKPIKRHPDFRIFAAMNPPTDVGKKELSATLRYRFTELYSEEMTDPQDISNVVTKYLHGINDAPVARIVEIYLDSRMQSEKNLVDGAGQRPRYSLRSLTRSLRATMSFMNIGIRPLKNCLFEAFLLNFQTLLSEESRERMYTFLKNRLEIFEKESNFPPARPGGKSSSAENWVLIKPFWLHAGQFTPIDWAEKDSNGIRRFVLTKTVGRYIRDITAAIAANVAPILIQGPTSVGKTTMIEYIAARTGHKCVRINNHEHTDVQEYIGGYVTNIQGQLEFKDGLLVEALRNGHWIILDELNLAPSDVLEALNRLLDDNRELLIPETGEIIKPADGFQLFATQNPPGIYGGRKPLSRAFRNRFLELSVSDLPLKEVQDIITESCGIPDKFSKMLVTTMKELQIHRQKSTLFQGKYGSVTTRDLIKWGKRNPVNALEVAQEGFMLLAEKLRTREEKDVVEDILNKACNVKLDASFLYSLEFNQETNIVKNVNKSVASVVSNKTNSGNSDSKGYDLIDLEKAQAMMRQGQLEVEGVKGVAITSSIRRMWKLVGRCIAHREPALLIGETGCGKTTVCQIFAAYRGQRIRILNCHQSTETADIIGGLRPIRGREIIKQSALNTLSLLVNEVNKVSNDDIIAAKQDQLVYTLQIINANFSINLDDSLLKLSIDELSTLTTELRNNHTQAQESEQQQEEVSSSPAKKAKLNNNKEKSTKSQQSRPAVATVPEFDPYARLVTLLEEVQHHYQRCKSLFEWQDGPLVTAMKEGDIFLLDEINLAEDAVIERLNSVLESNREITLAEKGGLEIEKIVAHPNFKFLATMNPGGDFGKRELSPALRSRFTEIWIPNLNNEDDIVLVVTELLRLSSLPSSQQHDYSVSIAKSMIYFMTWLNEQSKQFTTNGIQMSMRDILAWAKFITLSNPTNEYELFSSYLHGVHMLLLDGLGIGINVPKEKILEIKQLSVKYLLEQCPTNILAQVSSSIAHLNSTSSIDFAPSINNGRLTISSFSIPVGPLQLSENKNYVKDARNTTLNMGRVLRAMQLQRPILLEGPPGVGKTSLISNLATLTGHRLVRINLSEHSEISDLLGTDLPTQSSAENDSSTPKFKWCDGVFLTAMKQGDWVLLDELNLAPQSVLEGLNACFDHREEVFLPEIGMSMRCPSSFRVFCAQNPMVEGGGRKGLPQSFLSRFSRVYVESMSDTDMLEIVSKAYSSTVMATSDNQEIQAAADNISIAMDVDNDEISSSIQSLPAVKALPSNMSQYIPLMIKFIQRLQHNIVELNLYGRFGGPWEFNLRDIFRWCELLVVTSKTLDVTSQLLSNISKEGYLLADSVYCLFLSRLRTEEDRAQLCDDFKDIFGFPLEIDTSSKFYLLNDHEGIVGMSTLKLNHEHRFLNIKRQKYGASSDFHRNISKEVEIMCHCINLKWPLLLVGPYGTNKRNYINSLAHVNHNRVAYFSASTSTDSTELLGSFEHASPVRHLFQGLESMEYALLLLLNPLIHSIYQRNDSNISSTLEQVQQSLILFNQIEFDAIEVSHDNTLQQENGSKLLDRIKALLSNISGIALTLEDDAIKNQVIQKINLASKEFTMSFACDKDTNVGFEWVDGIVVRAVEQGYWLVIDNVNLCSASVLDRLNSLLEPNGTLLLTESGVGRVIVPHPNFRVFFVMDPSLGEISRAMRNRCTEIAFISTDNTNDIMNAWQLTLSHDISSFSSSLCEVYQKLVNSTIGDHFPKFNMFRRILEVLKLNINNNMLQTDALTLAVNSIIPQLGNNVIFNAISNNNQLISSVDFEMFVMLDIIRSFKSHTISVWSQLLIQVTFKNKSKLFEKFHESIKHLQTLALSSKENAITTLLSVLAYDLTTRNSVSNMENITSHLISIDPEYGYQLQFWIKQLSQFQISCLRNDNNLVSSWIRLINTCNDSIHGHFTIATLASKSSVIQCEELRYILLNVLVIKRASVLWQEQKSIELVRNKGITNDANMLSIGYALCANILTADSKELAMIGSFYRVVLLVDNFISNICKKVTLEVLQSQLLLNGVHDITSYRDILSRILCSSTYILQSSSSQSLLPWDQVSISMRWIKKGFMRCNQFAELATISQNAIQDMIYFDKAVSNYWKQPLINEKLRLWKEGGHVAVPATLSDWHGLFKIRETIAYFKEQLPHFLDLTANRNQQAIGPQSRKSVDLLKEWLCLYATFYWGSTNESHAKLLQQGNTRTVEIVPLANALEIKIKQHLERYALGELTVDSNDASNFNDTQFIFNQAIHQRINYETELAGDHSVFMLSEMTIVKNFLHITDILAKFVRVDALVSSELMALRNITKDTIEIALRYTYFDIKNFRELQSLYWYLDYFIDIKAYTSDHVFSFKQTAKTLLVGMESRLFSLVTRNMMNIPQSVSYSYDSSTLYSIINHFCVSKQSSNDSIMIPSEYLLSNGINRLNSVVALEIIAKHVDILCMFPHYGANKSILRLLNNDVALVSVASGSRSLTKMLQMFRVHSNSAPNDSVVARLNLLRNLTLDVINSCRDFYDDKLKQLLVSSKSASSSNSLIQSLSSTTVHNHISNPSIKELFRHCLPPILQVLTNSNTTDEISIAYAWVCIGILRVNLILPIMPVDPAIKPIVKAALLLEQNNNITNRLKIDSDARCLTQDSVLSYDKVLELEQLQVTQQKIALLEARGIQRPHTSDNHPTFLDLFNEIRNVIDGVASVSRVMSLANKLVNNDNTTISTQEELNWQATVSSLIDRLEDHYRVYEDITSPIISALANISYGLRFLAGKSNNNHSLVSVDQVSKSWKHIAQYPHLINVPLNKTDSLRSSLNEFIEVNKSIDILEKSATSSLKLFKQMNASNSLFPDSKNINIVVPHALLLNTLSRICYAVGGGTATIIDTHSLFHATLARFVESYLKGIDEKKRIEAAKNSLFKNKMEEKVYESNEIKEEEEALKENFPDHLKIFEDSINNSDAVAMEDDEEDNAHKNDDAATNNEDNELVALFQTFDESTAMSVIGFHVKMVFEYANKYLLNKGDTWTYGNQNASIISTKAMLQHSLTNYTVLTIKSLEWSIKGLVVPLLSQALHGTSSMLLASMCNQSQSLSVLSSSKRDASQHPDIDRDLLLLFNNNNTDEQVLDFHKDPNPSEVRKSIQPLKNMFNRASELLIMFAGNEFLIQVCKVSAKIMEFHITTPLGKMLISLELLLKKAQEWEQYAASHVSLQKEMSEISQIIQQWRIIELKSWENLLRSKDRKSVV